MLGVGCLFLGLGIYNFILNLLSVPPVRLSLPYLVVGVLIITVSVVKKPWLGR
jgi:hypothetical protein